MQGDQNANRPLESRPKLEEAKNQHHNQCCPREKGFLFIYSQFVDFIIIKFHAQARPLGDFYTAILKNDR